MHPHFCLQEEQLRVAIAMSLQEGAPNDGRQGPAEHARNGRLAAAADDPMASGDAATERCAGENTGECTVQGGGAGECHTRDIHASAPGVLGGSGRSRSLAGIGGLVSGTSSGNLATAGEVGDLQPPTRRVSEAALGIGPDLQPGGGAGEPEHEGR